MDDIRELWLGKPLVALPSGADIPAMAKKLRFKHLAVTIAMGLLAIGLLAVMCWVIVFYHSQMISTRIGEVLIIAAILALAGMQVLSVARTPFKKDLSNEAFLDFLKTEQRKRLAYQQRTQFIFFTIASLGLSFYIFEMVHTSPVLFLGSYLALALYLLITWFVLRPFSLKRKNKKLSETIARLESLSARNSI
jgi:hypothetical protein